MDVQLVDYTGKGQGALYAAAMLVFTKSTRLEMSPGLFRQVMDKTPEELMAELEYMANTIPSSWEFIDYTFMITGVTRAFTHQLVRTRNGSYAQQTMRMSPMSDFSYSTGPSIATVEQKAIYDGVMSSINAGYKALILCGVKPEDARGVLPTNIHTNICAKFNMRSFAELVSKRSSSRVQGEYREVVEKMVAAVLSVHPWCEIFLRDKRMRGAAELEKYISTVAADPVEKQQLVKFVDMMR